MKNQDDPLIIFAQKMHPPTIQRAKRILIVPNMKNIRQAMKPILKTCSLMVISRKMVLFDILPQKCWNLISKIWDRIQLPLLKMETLIQVQKSLLNQRILKVKFTFVVRPSFRVAMIEPNPYIQRVTHNYLSQTVPTRSEFILFSFIHIA